MHYVDLRLSSIYSVVGIIVRSLLFGVVEYFLHAVGNPRFFVTNALCHRKEIAAAFEELISQLHAAAHAVILTFSRASKRTGTPLLNPYRRVISRL